MATIIDSLIAKLGLDGVGFQKGMAAAQSQVSKFGSESMGTLKGQIAKAFAVGAVVAFAKTVISAASDIKDLSERLGISTDAVQDLQAKARQSGVEFGTLEAAIAKLSDRLFDIQQGSNEAMEPIKKLGLSIEDVLGVDRETAIQNIAKALSEVKDETEKAGLAIELFGGKSGLKTLQVLLESKRSGGFIFSKEDIKALDEVDKKSQQAAQNAKAAAAPLLTALFTGLSAGADVFRGKNPFARIQDELLNQEGEQPAEDKAAKLAQVQAALDRKKTEEAIELAAERHRNIQEDMVGLEEDLVKARLEALSHEEKIVALTERKLALEKQIANNNITTDFARRSKMEDELELLRINKELKDKDFRDPGTRSDAKGIFAPTTDSLARIGGFVGGTGGVSMEQLQGQTNMLLQQFIQIIDSRGMKLRKF